MKNVVFLFITTLLLLACSSDDENPQPEQNTELEIQKFTRTVHESNGDAYRLNYFFDETGKITNLLEDYFNDNSTVNNTYTYNSLNQIARIVTLFVDENRVGKTINYNYDATTNKLGSIQWIEKNGSIFNTINFTYEGNTVITEHGGKIFLFGNNDKLRETFASGGDPSFETNTETISYLVDLFTSLHYESSLGSSENYDFKYEDKVNPLFKGFDEHINKYIYGFVGNMTNQKFNFSPNIYTKVEYTSSIPIYNYIETKTT